MLSEKQIYDAKVFLRSYKDAIMCIEQTVIKKTTFDHYSSKYESVISGESKQETMNLFKFSKEFLTLNFMPEAKSCEEFYKQLLRIDEINK